MRLPTIILMGFVAFVMTFAVAVSRGPGPDASEGDSLGFVMGRDFTALLANPNVSLKVVRGSSTVTFVWTSDSAVRLSEVEALGQHIIGARELMQMREPVEPNPEDLRTVSVF